MHSSSIFHSLLQRGSVYATLTEGDVPNLVVHKETLSHKHKWSGPGGIVSISKGGRHGFLHASVSKIEEY